MRMLTWMLALVTLLAPAGVAAQPDSVRLADAEAVGRTARRLADEGFANVRAAATPGPVGG